MSDKSENQIEEWLKKLERESWQLELLVSAFTIFLLLGANSAYQEFLHSLNYQYNMSSGALGVISIFLLIIKNSIQALTIALIVHLMLRGFWIGTIGLRSVQSTVDFDKLKYNDFFTEKLKNKNGIVSLDRMVVQLDEICSVIFAFSFMIISVLIAFGMYLIGLGLIGLVFTKLFQYVPSGISVVILIIAAIVVFSYLIMGFIYMIDYFTLGFFKKIRWFSRIYYPFYRLFNFITLSRLSRSIYYYLISKFSKSRIRVVFTIIGSLVLLLFLVEFDQHPYYPENDNPHIASSNAYDDDRPDDEYIERISIPSKYIDEPFFPLFIRYNPVDNALVRANCPDFEPIKDDGINSRMGIISGSGKFQITARDYTKEDANQLMICLSSIYQVSVNDSVYQDVKFRFYEHPGMKQKGLLTVIPTDAFKNGENILSVQKVRLDSVGNQDISSFVQLPFWYHRD